MMALGAREWVRRRRYPSAGGGIRPSGTRRGPPEARAPCRRGNLEHSLAGLGFWRGDVACQTPPLRAALVQLDPGPLVVDRSRPLGSGSRAGDFHLGVEPAERAVGRHLDNRLPQVAIDAEVGLGEILPPLLRPLRFAG